MRRHRQTPFSIVLILICLAMAGISLYVYMRPASPAQTSADLIGPEAAIMPESTPVDPGTDTVLAIEAIPFSAPDWPSPFRGAEQWHYANPTEIISYPGEGNHQAAMDVYKRSGLCWDQLEKAENIYTFEAIDELFQQAIEKKQRVSFGIMTQYPGREDGPGDAGALMAYPLYVHQKLQAGVETERDFRSPDGQRYWIPNYNAPYYQARFDALLSALARHIASRSFRGIPYAKALGYVDIRGFGSWGEWHMGSAVPTPEAYPSGRRPTAEALKAIIDAHLRHFPSVPLTVNISVFDGGQLRNTMIPPEVGYHALTVSNTWGKLGWRRDNWGWNSAYIQNWLQKNPTVYRGMRFDTAIMNRWKYAPILGEGPCGGTKEGGPCSFHDVPRQVRLYHASMIGNGNFCGEHTDARGRDSMRMAWKESGYRLEMLQLVLAKQIVAGKQFRVRIDWINNGVAPLYEAWDTWFVLEDINSNTSVWEGKSVHSLRMKLPSVYAYPMQDQFKLPSTLKPGTYRLSVVLKDPLGYRDPLPLAIPGRRKDGSYVLSNHIQISGS